MLTQLHQLSLAIRKASNRNSFAKTERLFDEDGEYLIVKNSLHGPDHSENTVIRVRYEITDVFRDFVKQVLESRWLKSVDTKSIDKRFRQYRETLLDRCSDAIATRRRQLAYFRGHQSRLEKQRKTKFVSGIQQPAQPSPQPSMPKPQQHIVETMSSGLLETPAKPKFSFEEGSEFTSSETVPSEFQLKSFRLAPQPMSSPSTTSSEGRAFQGTGFEVPTPPPIETGEKEKACPYCCLVLPVDTFSRRKKSKKWRNHLLEDIQPYICLFANCSLGGKCYRTFKDWRTHLNQPHNGGWSCPACNTQEIPAGDRAAIFDTSADFQSHLNLEHPEFDSSSVQELVRNAAHPALPPKQCFVCLEEVTGLLSLQGHMANHLESAFLLALPWRDDIEEEGEMASDKPLSVVESDNEGAQDIVAVGGLNDLWDLGTEQVNNLPRSDRLSPHVFASRLLEIDSRPISGEQRVEILQSWVSRRTLSLRPVVLAVIAVHYFMQGREMHMQQNHYPGSPTSTFNSMISHDSLRPSAYVIIFIFRTRKVCRRRIGWYRSKLRSVVCATFFICCTRRQLRRSLMSRLRASVWAIIFVSLLRKAIRKPQTTSWWKNDSASGSTRVRGRAGLRHVAAEKVKELQETDPEQVHRLQHGPPFPAFVPRPRGSSEES